MDPWGLISPRPNEWDWNGYYTYTYNLIDPVLEPKHGPFLSKQRSNGF